MAELSRHPPRRGGRAVDRAGLENRKAERPREFESHPLRHAKKWCNPPRPNRELWLEPPEDSNAVRPAGAVRAVLKAKPQYRSQSEALDNLTPSANFSSSSS